MAISLTVRRGHTAERGRADVPAIGFRSVSMEFDSDTSSTAAVDDVSLDVRPGEFVALIGPSGCGKSTLLNMVAGLLKPTSGTVTFRGQQVNGVNREVGYMTQQSTLLPWRSVADNIAVPLAIRGVKRVDRKPRVSEAVRMVGLEEFEHHMPHQLSGGMRQRVQLARTLVYNPETLLMDEPFGALDALLKLSIQEQLAALWEQSRQTVLYVTHDIGEAIALADRIVILSRRPARIVAVEVVDLERPRDLSDLRLTPEFGHLYERVWAQLRSEVEDKAGEARLGG